MLETKGHKASQPGLRGHSHDADQDLMKQFVVAKVLPTGGKLWLKSFDTREEAAKFVAHTPVGTQHKIIDQFKENI